jgi:1-phosphofructokinase
MIYTVTLNPAVDYYIQAPQLQSGNIIRTENPLIRAGGKGINVGVVLSRLGVPCRALGFICGFTGDEVRRQCRKYQLNTSFIRVPGEKTRINIKITGGDGDIEINAPAPVVPHHIAVKLLKQTAAINTGDIIVLSGSIPESLTDNFYGQICAGLPDGVLIAADCTGEALRAVLPYKPFLIKPNHIELCDFVKKPVTTDRKKLFKYAEELLCGITKKSGAKNIIVSVGSEGAILIDMLGVRHSVDIPDGEFISAVGSGDSLLAGFIDGYIRTGDFSEALKRGVAAGSATAYSEWLATKQAIDSLMKTMK